MESKVEHHAKTSNAPPLPRPPGPTPDCIHLHGLGPDFAHELARAHGGDITYQPTEDGLNAFKLTLPMRD